METWQFNQQCFCKSRQKPQLTSYLLCTFNFLAFCLRDCTKIDNNHCTLSTNSYCCYFHSVHFGKDRIWYNEDIAWPFNCNLKSLLRWTSCLIFSILSFSVGTAKRISYRQLFDRLLIPTEHPPYLQLPVGQEGWYDHLATGCWHAWLLCSETLSYVHVRYTFIQNSLPVSFIILFFYEWPSHRFDKW